MQKKKRKDRGIVRKNLTGKKFGKLTVIKFSGWVKQGKATSVSFWECLCECGTVKKIKGTHLSRGDTKSCGCYKPQMLPSGESALNSLIKNYKRHAEERQITFKLTREEFKLITKNLCFYCQSEPQQVQKTKRGNGSYLYNGIDRLDNSLGYFFNNCVACCKLCNWMKRDLSTAEFKEHVYKIYETTNKSRTPRVDG